MDFFDSRLRLTPEEGALDDRDDDEFSMPEWFGPPDDVIPGRSGQLLILNRTDDVVIAISGVDAYPNGISMVLHVAARRTTQDRASWREFEDTFWNEGGRHVFAGEVAESGQIRFGVAFADGTRATTMDERPMPIQGAPQPPPAPVLVLERSGGSGGSRSMSQEFSVWLWPLPPPGALTLHYAWPALGIDAGSVDLDASEFRDAAARSEPYWP